jgi:UDP-glucuronate 4-epimerase
MNYLLTGAAGFIGFHTALKLAGQGHNVLGIDSLNDYYPPSLKKDRLKELGIEDAASCCGKAVRSSRYRGFQFARLRIEDIGGLFSIVDDFIKETGSTDRVIHLAAQAGVRYSLENPQVYLNSNLSGFLNILELCRNLKTAHLVYASSSSVYGLNEKQPCSVHDAVDHPVSLYAATKRSNELMAHTYSHLFGISATGLRFFTVYGPWGRPDMAYYKFSLALMNGKPIEVYNNGEMWRDFTYIDDIVEGILLASEHIPVPLAAFNSRFPDPACSSAPHRIYNLGNNHPEKLSDFIETLEQILRKKAFKKYLPIQDGDVLSTTADIEDTRKELGWAPHTDITTGLEAFVSWFAVYYNNV